jgi:predicted transcriptional regulator of viral defense system
MNSTIKRFRKYRLGRLEQQFLSYVQFKRMSVVRVGEVRPALGILAMQEKKMLSRLARGGTIVRLKRGVYLVPPRLPVGGVWNPGEYLILRELMRAYRDGRYQLCGWPVFNRYGLTEQVPTRVYAYNNRISGDRAIAGQEYTFIKVSDSRLGGIAAPMTPDGVGIIMPTKARALMDAIFDWSRFNTLPAAYAWIRTAVGKDRRLADELAEMACRYGNQGTIRRIGFVLERMRLRGRWKKRLKGGLRDSSSIIPLVPGRKASGPVSREWGVIANG